MEFTKKLNKSISRLGFGGAAISGEGGGYGFGNIDEDQARELLLAAFNSGVNLFDFAPIYGYDLAEKRAGSALKQAREKVYLVSKCGVDWHDNGRVNMDNRPQTVLKMLEKSLRSFQSDYIDFYMVHWPDPHVDIRRTVEVLYDAKEKGKIVHIGLCNTTKEDLALAMEVAPIEALQGQANFFEQDALADLAKVGGGEVFTMGWGTYDKGILAGTAKAGRVFDSSDCRSWAPWWKKSNWKKRAEKASDVMEKLSLSKQELSLGAFKFAATKADTVLCGMKNPKHIEDNLSCLESENPSWLKEAADEFALF